MFVEFFRKDYHRRRRDVFLSEVALGQKANKSGMFKRVFLLFAVCLLLGGLLSSTVSAQSGFDDPGARSARGGGGDLAPVDSEVDGGEIKIGTTSQVVILFRNDSGRAIETSAIQLYPSSTISGVVSLNQCSQEPLPAGAVCAIALSVKGLQSGPWRIDMLMRHSGRSRLVQASVTGNVEVTDDAADQFLSDIEAIPSEVDFGDAEASQPIIKGVVLRNSTSDTIDINSIYIEAADQSGYSLRTDCERLVAGQACIVTIKWSPVLKGQASGVLLVEHTGPTSVASINLDGDFDPEDVDEADVFPEAVPGKGLLVSSAAEVDFGSNIENISTITVSLVNVGDAPLTLKDIRLAGSDTGLSLGSGGCLPETVLEPIEACPLIVSWSPVRQGEIIDDLQILHDGARGVLILPVRGEADGVVSQDSKAVRLAGTGTASISADGDITDGDLIVVRDDNIDPTSVLDGFVITSHSPTRAIISGPGGSRIVFNNEDVVLGGFLWKVNIRSSGIEFTSGPDKALLLFDRSLSSLNRSGSQSSSSSSSSSSSDSTTTSTDN